MRWPTLTRLTALAAAALLAVGCGDDTTPSLTTAGDAAGLDIGTTTPADTAAAGPDIVEPPAPTHRAAKRMTIAQLAASIPVVTGGIRWEEDFGQGPQDMLGALSATLGVPDYVRVTEENLEPSIIIAKFMSDAAQRVCTAWIARDRQQPPADRTLVRHADWSSLAEADVKATLRSLQLRFFSRYVPADDDGPIADLYELFGAASSGAPTGQEAYDGWLAVCLAMMTDPEFVIY